MSNLSVKHSCSFSLAKLLYREYDRGAARVKLRLDYKDENLNRNPLLQ
jgi:hypothetical protein